MENANQQNNFTLLRVANLLALCAFVASGVLQHNDPDPWQWMAFYTAAACICMAFHMGKLYWQVAAVLGVFAVLWCLSLLPAFIGKASLTELFSSLSMQTEDVEEAREAGGALLVAAWCWVLGRNKYEEKLARTSESD